ncbi:MAG: dihydroorotate dehydrogenase, partial [Planctomycetes bacterium]|nr:dihydroorotate dehydrogenase [Planctomycetota bacterium]
MFYVGADGTSLNTLGLPNGGLPYYEKNLPGMVQIAHDAGKKMRASLAGFSPSEYVKLAQLAVASGVDVTELNTGCPNVWGGGEQKPIAAYSPELMTEILSRVVAEYDSKMELAVKVSPYEPGMLRQIASIIASIKEVHSVVSANTFPNAVINYEDGRSVITFGDGYAGLAGTALKPIVL